MDILIRKATENDAFIVGEIAKAQWAGIYDSYKNMLGDDIYNTLYKDPLEQKKEAVINSVMSGNVVVAECDGEVCGFATYHISGKTGTLSNNAVSKEFCGRGIAQMLYNHIFDEMKAAGVEVVNVSTGLDDAHAPARRAYEKAGFEVGLPKITYYKKLK